MDIGDIVEFFSFLATRFRYYASILLIVISLLFTASVWSSPPSLAYIVIPFSSGFALLMTLLWSIEFIKTAFGRVLLGLNLLICSYSIIIIISIQSSFPTELLWIGLYSCILGSIGTMILGILHQFALIKAAKNVKVDDLLDTGL